jgi:hypothetical protein
MRDELSSHMHLRHELTVVMNLRILEDLRREPSWRDRRSVYAGIGYKVSLAYRNCCNWKVRVKEAGMVRSGDGMIVRVAVVAYQKSSSLRGAWDE